MKPNKIVIISILLLFPFFVKSQSVSQAEKLFNSGKYEESSAIYKILVEQRPSDAMLKYKYARTLMAINRYDEAIPFLQVAVDKKIKKANYYLYQAYFNRYYFDKAASSLMLYIELMDGKLDNDKQIQAQLLQAQLGASMIDRVEDIAIVDSIKIEKLNFLSAYRLPSELGRIEHYYELLGVQTPKQQMVYYSGRGDRMFFADNDNGDLNLKISFRLIDGWSDVVNISDVLNTGEDENYPYVMADGVTIYFASKGHNSLGGYDIFMSRYNISNEDYSEPVNIGMPFNSPANDYMMVLDEMAQVGWFATDRFQHPDTVVVYEFVPSQQKKMIENEDEEYMRQAAQLKVYRKANYHTSQDEDAEESKRQKKNEINFIVTDKLVYTDIAQFVSEDAKLLCQKVIETEKRLSTIVILLEGKRKEFMFLDKDEDKQQLRIDIMEMEKDVIRYQGLVQEFILQTRRAELNELNRK